MKHQVSLMRLRRSLYLSRINRENKREKLKNLSATREPLKNLDHWLRLALSFLEQFLGITMVQKKVMKHQKVQAMNARHIQPEGALLQKLNNRLQRRLLSWKTVSPLSVPQLKR